MAYEIYFYNTNEILLTNNGGIYVKGQEPIIDIYYGVSTKSIVNEDDIKNTFLTASGFVGSPKTSLSDGRLYIFPTGYTYKYWCIPDLPNSGERVINQITNGVTNTILIYDSYYNNYQSNPTPLQSITYGKIIINGIIYRIYRTITKSSSNYEQFVCSF